MLSKSIAAWCTEKPTGDAFDLSKSSVVIDIASTKIWFAEALFSYRGLRNFLICPHSILYWNRFIGRQ